MSLAEQVYNEVQKLPDQLRQEVLDFIGYLEVRHGLISGGLDELKKAQQPSMDNVWNNKEDDIWNE